MQFYTEGGNLIFIEHTLSAAFKTNAFSLKFRNLYIFFVNLQQNLKLICQFSTGQGRLNSRSEAFSLLFFSKIVFQICNILPLLRKYTSILGSSKFFLEEILRSPPLPPPKKGLNVLGFWEQLYTQIIDFRHKVFETTVFKDLTSLSKIA